MGSVPERPPIIRGEHVHLRAPERSDIEWEALGRDGTGDGGG